MVLHFRELYTIYRFLALHLSKKILNPGQFKVRGKSHSHLSHVSICPLNSKERILLGVTFWIKREVPALYEQLIPVLYPEQLHAVGTMWRVQLRDGNVNSRQLGVPLLTALIVYPIHCFQIHTLFHSSKRKQEPTWEFHHHCCVLHVWPDCWQQI